MKKLLLLSAVIVLIFGSAVGQDRKAAKKNTGEGAFYSGVYGDLFLQAGYSHAAIDDKVAKAYHAVFEGPYKRRYGAKMLELLGHKIPGNG